MRSYARLVVERTGTPSRSRVRRQRSHGALVLRPTIDRPPWWSERWGLTSANTAAIRLVAGAAGPIGGDDWHFDVAVGAESALLLSAVAGTVALPGAHGEASSSRVNIHVGAGGALIWEPGVQIAAADCRHETFNDIHLEPGARLFVREEAVLGRHGEQPGRFGQRLRVSYDGRPIYDQELRVGEDAPGWAGPAVMGQRRALGSLLVVDPDSAGLAGVPRSIIDGIDDTAVMALTEGASLITSLDYDSVSLRANLQAAFEATIAEARHPSSDETTHEPQANDKPYTVKRMTHPST